MAACCECPYPAGSPAAISRPTESKRAAKAAIDIIGRHFKQPKEAWGTTIALWLICGERS